LKKKKEVKILKLKFEFETYLEKLQMTLR